MTASEQGHSGAPVHPIVFSDFDGTITLSDVTDEILSRLAAPGWQELERLWIDGKIGSRECLEQQLALVKTSMRELNALIDSVPLDPGFHNFVRFTQKSQIPFVVLSDGLDCVIRRVLAHADLHFRPRNGSQFFSTSGRLVNGRMRISFPHAMKSCTHGCATCKPRIMQKLKHGHWPVIYAGDGLSDRHAVAEADFVYARQPLLDLCREKEIPSRPFETFADVQDALRKWLDGDAARELSEAARGRTAWLREQAVGATL